MLQTLLIVLAILAGLVILGVVALLVALKVIQWRLRRTFAELNDSVKDLGYAFQAIKAGLPPAWIHLDATDGPTWNDPERVERDATALRVLDFQDIGTYAIREMEGTNLRAMMHEPSNAYAVVYEHPQAGVWTEIYGEDSAGRSLTVSSRSEDTVLDRPDNDPLIILEGVAPAELFRQFQHERSFDRMLRDVSAEQFPLVFEQAYARIAEWRLARGFATSGEIKAITDASGQPLDARTAGLARSIMAQYASEQIAILVRERYAEQTGIPHGERAGLADRLVVVHDRMTSPEVVGLFDSDLIDDDEFDVESLPAQPRDAFRIMNDRQPERERHRYVGHVDQPVPADVYERSANEQRSSDDE